MKVKVSCRPGSNGRLKITNGISNFLVTQSVMIMDDDYADTYGSLIILDTSTNPEVISMRSPHTGEIRLIHHHTEDL